MLFCYALIVLRQIDGPRLRRAELSVVREAFEFAIGVAGQAPSSISERAAGWQNIFPAQAIVKFDGQNHSHSARFIKPEAA